MLVITKKVEEIDVFHQMRNIIAHGYVILRTGDVEKAVGLSQRIVSICHAMYDCMKTNDEVLSAPPSGYSTTVTIKFYL